MDSWADSCLLGSMVRQCLTEEKGQGSVGPPFSPPLASGWRHLPFANAEDTVAVCLEQSLDLGSRTQFKAKYGWDSFLCVSPLKTQVSLSHGRPLLKSYRRLVLGP